MDSSRIRMRGPTAFAVAMVCVTGANADIGAFSYDPITEPILSASFSADFAALTAHRTVLGEEVNRAALVDVSAAGLPRFDMSDELFGTAVWPSTPDLDQGALGTGVLSVAIDPSFFPALASGDVGLSFLATDTGDGLFAIDFLALTIMTASETTIVAYHGPLGAGENNGFGLGLPDGGDLPGAMPGVLAATGTGFDEEIASKAIEKVPAPASAALLALGASGLLFRGRRR